MTIPDFMLSIISPFSWMTTGLDTIQDQEFVQDLLEH